MSRSLILILLSAAIFAGCANLQSGFPADQPPSEKVSKGLEEWLRRHAQVRALSEEQVLERLNDVGLLESEEALYYYGLLNQQLISFSALIEARDAFTTLSESEALSAEQRELATVFLIYNQNRINALTKIEKLSETENELRERLNTTEEDNRLLKTQIQALTDLESDISTRKEE